MLCIGQCSIGNNLKLILQIYLSIHNAYLKVLKRTFKCWTKDYSAPPPHFRPLASSLIIFQADQTVFDLIIATAHLQLEPGGLGVALLAVLLQVAPLGALGEVEQG